MKYLTLFFALVFIGCARQAPHEPVVFEREEITPPNDWAPQFQMSQAESITGFSEIVHFSGQTALVADSTAEMGLGVANPGDIRKQMEVTLASIDNLLDLGGYARENIAHVNIYTVDMAGFLANYDVYATWISEAGIRPPQTALGVASLVTPELMIEIDITVVR